MFLSPDDGNSNIVKLHDKLYSGPMRNTLRLDVDFFAHIGIGSTLDSEECKSLVDLVNSQNIRIEGSIRALTVVSYGDRKLQNRNVISLQ